MSEKINLVAVFALIVYPILLIAYGIYYGLNYSIGWLELGLFVGGYYVSNITVGIGLHRLWSHDTYKINKFIEFILVLLAAGTLQGPVLSWASNHFKHHAYTDTDQDPHSALKYKNKFMGFLWSHIGWMLVGEGSYKSIDRMTMVKLGRNKLLKWQLKNYWSLAILMNTLVPALLGYIISGTYQGAVAGFLFVGLGRALQQQITFCVNSACHFVGTQPYIKGTSRDVWWLALFLLGENWHNFHHAFPNDYRNGAKWYQFDVHKWIIFLMSKCGLAWDLKITSDIRIQTKISQTMSQLASAQKEKLESIYKKLEDLAAICQHKALELENFSAKSGQKIAISLSKVQSRINDIQGHLQQQIKNFDDTSQRISQKISISIDKKVRRLEEYLLELCSKIEQQHL